jgi:pimeloyl-ACP methyl ester carboxylesterase
MTIALPLTTVIAAEPSQYWTWRNFKIHYVKAGEPKNDRPALLLVHGFGASTDHWKKNIADLKEEFEVYAIDLLGFGRSEKADTAYSGDLWCDQLHDFIQEVIQRPAVVAGNSIGGYAALATVARFPDQTAGAILLNPAGGFSEDYAKREANPTPWQKFLSAAMKTALNQDWIGWLLFKRAQSKKTIRATLLQVYVNKSEVTDELVEDIYRPSLDEGASKVFSLVFRSPKGQPMDALLETMTKPLYIIWGEKDPWIGDPIQRGQRFTKYYPSTVQTYINAGHCPHDDAPIEVNQLIREWLM